MIAVKNAFHMSRFFPHSFISSSSNPGPDVMMLYGVYNIAPHHQLVVKEENAQCLDVKSYNMNSVDAR